MTPLTTPVHRRCPEIIDPRGRALDVSLTADNGGTLRLRWKGSKEADTFNVGLGEIMAMVEGDDDIQEDAPVEKKVKGAVTYDQLSDRLHTLKIDMKERLALLTVFREIRSHHEWLESGSTISWEAWKKKQSEPRE